MAIHKLTEAKIAKLTRKGMYGDGGGLWLQVTNDGAGKSWCFRWKDRKTGNGRIMGLGPIYKTDIHQARELAKAQWQLIKQGLDPVAVRDGIKLDAAHKLGLAKTFSQVADEFLDTKIHVATRSKRTKRLAVSILGIARRAFGDLPIQKIDSKMIMDKTGLRTMWTAKHPTAEKLLGYIQRIFSVAIAGGYYVGENPARWEAHIEHMVPLHVHRTVHHSALPFKDIGCFVEKLRSYEYRNGYGGGRPNIALLLEFVVLTGCRIGEAQFTTWGHIDRQNMVWAVPAQNHKTGTRTGQPLLRPITKPMLAVLDEMSRRYPDHAAAALIFPSGLNGTLAPFGQPSPGRFLQVSLKYEITVHGFRSTFIDWCRANRYPKELYDAQTGHIVGNAVAQAYARDQLVDQRRGMMEAWGQYCAQPAPWPTEGSNVASLAERREKAAS